MPNRFQTPDEQFFTSDGTTILAGGKLYFYASGTSTKLNTYSDSALTIANTNPVILDSAGRTGSIFLQNLAYKVILAPSTDTDPPTSPIWSFDPVYTSDFSARAKVTGFAGNPNGFVAGTAASAGIGADEIFDTVNNILYIATVTGNAATTVWTAVNPSAAAQVQNAPQGYLTPTSGTPIITGDVIGQGTLVYTPFIGNQAWVFNGTSFGLRTFSELTLTLSASNAANTIYDVWLFDNSGVLTLATGPAWNNSTPGSGVIGTGAGTTQRSRLNGLLVNTVVMTARNDGNTYTINPNFGLCLGSIFVDSIAGQLTFHRSYGQSRKWAISNVYNRQPLYLKAGDPTASWVYNTATIRASNGNSANNLTIFSCLAEDVYDIKNEQNFICTGPLITKTSNQIGINSTTAGTGKIGLATTADGLNLIGFTLSSKYLSPPLLGVNVITSLELGGTSGTNTFFGTETNMLLSASWRG